MKSTLFHPEKCFVQDTCDDQMITWHTFCNEPTFSSYFIPLNQPKVNSDSSFATESTHEGILWSSHQQHRKLEAINGQLKHQAFDTDDPPYKAMREAWRIWCLVLPLQRMPTELKWELSYVMENEIKKELESNKCPFRIPILFIKTKQQGFRHNQLCRFVVNLCLKMIPQGLGLPHVFREFHNKYLYGDGSKPYPPSVHIKIAGLTWSK